MLVVCILILICYVVDCVISHKIYKVREEELNVLKHEVETMELAYTKAVNQRNILFNEIKKFNDNFNAVDDGK